MNKNILIILIGYILGIIIGLYFKIGIALLILFWIIALVLKRNTIYINITIIFAILSFGYILFSEYSYTNLYKDIDTIEAYGEVISDANLGEYYNSYSVKITYYKENNKIKNTKVVIQVDKNKQQYKYGDTIKFKGKFSSPGTQRNYNGFDYKEYLKTQKIYGIIKIVKAEKLKDTPKITINYVMNLLRNSIISKIHNIDKSEAAEILIGILFGTTGNISEETIQDFKNSGLSHLMAVSGINVSYVVVGIVFFLQKIKIIKKLAYIVSIVGIIMFMSITNFTDSVTRAGIMAIIIIFSKIIYRQPDVLSSICFSFLIILIENPYKLFSVGLQLSYAGTIGIVYFYTKLKGKMELTKKLIHKIFDIVLVCVAAQIVVLPLLILHFNTIPIYFLIANVLVSPLIPIIMLLGIIHILISYISIKISLITYIPLSMCLNLLIFLNKTISNLPISTILVKTPYLFSITTSYFLMAFWLFYENIIFQKYYKLLKNKICLTLFNKNLYLPAFNKKLIIKVISLILIINIVLTVIIDYPKEFTLYFVDQTCPIMIQELNDIFERTPLISMAI